MDRKKALELIKPHLTEHRYIHTLGVRDTALKMAEKEAIDLKKVETAAIFHDYAKFRPKQEMRAIIQSEGWNQDFITYGDELLHAPAGAYLVEKEIGIEDKEILSAIYWHTTGKVNMNPIEKIIFLADYIEPNRKFPGVEETREEAQRSIDGAIIMALRNTITFLMKKAQPVFPETLFTYNDLIFRMKNQQNREADETNGR